MTQLLSFFFYFIFRETVFWRLFDCIPLGRVENFKVPQRLNILTQIEEKWLELGWIQLTFLKSWKNHRNLFLSSYFFHYEHLHGLTHHRKRSQKQKTIFYFICQFYDVSRFTSSWCQFFMSRILKEEHIRNWGNFYKFVVYL